MAAGWFSSAFGRWLLGRWGAGSGVVADLKPSFGLWGREPGRGKWSREPGRGLVMTGGAEWIGTYKLPVGGPSGGKRRFFVDFSNMEEIAVDGDTLSGTPTVTVSPSGPTISSVAFNTTTQTVRINGQTKVAAAYTLLLFTISAGTAAAGDYTLTIHADTAAGYVFEPTATLTLE